jgi:hypothetical protein
VLGSLSDLEVGGGFSSGNPATSQRGMPTFLKRHCVPRSSRICRSARVARHLYLVLPSQVLVILPISL